jgi:protein tyrosine kinase modulator
VAATDQAKHYIDMAWRRRWWIVVPAAAGLAVAVYLSLTLPKIYRATTTILVTRQSVPEDIVRSTVTMRIDERMKSLRIQVMSRQYLEQVAREFGLISEGDDEATIERKIRRLSDQSVDLDWDKQGLSWFKIMVDDRDPKRAAGIANRLAELFIQQNTKLRQAQAQGTVDTVDEWRKKGEQELRLRDDKIAKFKKEHLYELPDQQAATLQLLNAAQTHVTQLSGDIQLKSDRLATARAEERSRRSAAQTGAVPVGTDDPDTLALAQMERDLADLLINYTEENPLVRKKREQLAAFKASHPQLAAPKAAGSEEGGYSSPEIARLQSEIKVLESDREREQRNVDVLRARIDAMPARAQELAELTRDYDNIKQQYDTTLSQNEEARRALDIESAKKGEQFQVQDLARPPAVPFKPNALQLLILGLLGGLAIGAGLAFLLEFLDHSVRSEEEFAQLFPNVAVLGAIPNLDMDTTSPKKGALGRYSKHRAAGAALLAALVSAASHLLGGLVG